MIEELKQKVLSDPSVQDAVTLGSVASVGTAGAADLTGVIDLFATTLSTLMTLAAFVGVVLHAINVYHKKKQIKIKTARDLVELERARLELKQLRKTYKA